MYHWTVVGNAGHDCNGCELFEGNDSFYMCALVTSATG